MEEFARGSEWRKWDLHAHTPVDKDWEESVDLSSEDLKKEFAKKYIDFALQQGLSAIAITDHNFCNNISECLIPYIQHEAKLKKIVVFPGFEITTHDGSGIHLLVLFPEDTELQKIYDVVKLCFCAGTTLVTSPVPVSNKSISEIKKIIDDAKLDSIFIFAHANSSNGVLDRLTINGTRRVEEWLNEDVQITQLTKSKEQLIDDISSPRTKAFYSSVFNRTDPLFSRNMAYVIASDCRRITKDGVEDRNYLGAKYTWIKADLTFEGLKQIIRESLARICTETEPFKLNEIRLNKTKYIDSIEISSASTIDKWFEQNIKLNAELVSIIGNKGSGKSALSDILGLLGNSHNIDYFSFLKNEKFYKTKSANEHRGSIKWKDGEKIALSLTIQSKLEEIERVKYIPQNYFETICNLTDEQDGFKQEIEKVIYSHLKEEEKLQAKNFKDLIKIKKAAIQKEVSRLKDELYKVIEQYVNHEKCLATSNLKLNQSNLDEFSRQIKDIDTEMKTLIAPPQVGDIVDDSKIKELEQQIKKETELLNSSKENLKILVRNEQIINDSLSKIDTFHSQYDTLKQELSEDLFMIEISLDSVINLVINKDIFLIKRTELESQKNKLLNNISEKEKIINGLLENKKHEEGKLSDEHKKYQDYLNKKQELEQKKREILGDKEHPFDFQNTFYYYEYLCSPNYLKAISDQKNRLYCKMKDYSGLIFDKLLEIKNVYQKLRKDVENFIEEFKEIPEANIKISFNTDIKINKSNFEEIILSYLAKKGDFYGDKRSQTFKILFYDKALDDKSMIMDICSEFIDKITDEKEKSIEPSLRVKDTKTWIELYEYLFSLDYLDVNYALEFNNKTISLLSPGERGLLLLIFFLLADKSNNPLILDQPEENLDNQTIHNVLVPMIKNAKKKRQVIIVTHNPNLAVVCDSEQIIYSKFSTTKSPKIKYITGSIENPIINGKLVDILEGTMPAFRIRDEKYIDK